MAPGLALGQTRPPDTSLPRDEAIFFPTLPPTPPALLAEVTVLHEVVRATAGCNTVDGHAGGTPDRRCAQWYARLARGGAAAAFAIGEQFTPARVEGPRHLMEPLRDEASEGERGAQLAQLLASTRRPEAVSFLASYLIRTVTVHDAPPTRTDVAALGALRALTGDDPAPTTPWEGDEAHLNAELARLEIASLWSRWMHAHEGRPVVEWRAVGAQRALERLGSDDIVLRYAGIRRLAGERAHRAAVITSLRALLAHDDLPAAARVHLQRLVRRHNLPVAVGTR